MNTENFEIKEKPFYLPVRDEIEIFERAWLEKIPVLLKGPTGCGKTRFVEYMAYYLRQKYAASAKPGGAGTGLLFTVSCHEDLTARDLVGRHILKGNEVTWTDGPASMAVKCGGILYLDEIVEARRDVIVIIHPLTDYRRILPVEALGIQMAVPDSFMTVLSYNPGYQSIHKKLKQSTRQRFIAISFTFPPPEKELVILEQEAGIERAVAEQLVILGNDVRNISGMDMEEGVSTRCLVYAARLIKKGIDKKRACSIAIGQAITDEREEIEAIEIIINKIFK